MGAFLFFFFFSLFIYLTNYLSTGTVIIIQAFYRKFMYSTMTTNRCSGPVRNNKEMRCSQRSKEEGGGKKH